MAWRKFLFFANGGESSSIRAATAASLAARHSAALEVVSPVVLPTLIGYGETVMAAAVYEDLLSEARKTAKDIGESTLAECRSTDVSLSISMPELARGDLERTAAMLGHSADLLIIGQPAEDDYMSENQAVLTAGLFGSGRPVLMLPRWTKPHAVGKRVLIAWKPTREASRAVHDALPMLRQAEAVRLFTGADESKGRSEYAAEIQRMTHFLKAHRIPLSDQDAGPSPRGVSILEEAERWGADLIVMGAYGHSRLQEVVFGGATRDVIRRSRVAVLLSH